MGEKMNKLEAQAIIEDTGNYAEEEIEDVMSVYEEVCKHIGFRDNRKDKRFVVKFHDIFYYEPYEMDEDTQKIRDGMFENFCEYQYDSVVNELTDNNIDLDYMLTRICVGHYQAFTIDIPEITEENAAQIAMDAYGEYGYINDAKNYVKNYIYTVNVLQDLEDNYMEYWIEFLKENEQASLEKYIKETEEKYNKDKLTKEKINA